MEIMIWFNRQGSIQPIGSVVGNTTIGGRSWQVWQGSNGSNNVISYVAPSAITSWNFSVLDFINDVRNRGAITNSWYLTSVQAGFEPWIGGAGLAVNNFSATVNGGGSRPLHHARPRPRRPRPRRTTPPAGSTACRVTYATDSWSNGFVANVTVANTGSSPVNGWSLGFTLPGGQAVTNSWNATCPARSGAVTARNVAWNGSIPAGGSASFGFQGTYSGSFAAPSRLHPERRRLHQGLSPAAARRRPRCQLDPPTGGSGRGLRSAPGHAPARRGSAARSAPPAVRTQRRPRIRLARVRPQRHRPLRQRGDGQRRVHPEVRRHRRAVHHVQARVAVHPVVRRPPRRSPAESPMVAPPRMCAVIGMSKTSPIEPPGMPADLRGHPPYRLVPDRDPGRIRPARGRARW